MLHDIFVFSFWLKILFSVICGGMIGLERQIRGKPVGIRTSVMICMGTMLFIYLATQIEGGYDTPRVLGQVVSGIGFLGAGVIIMRGESLSGVTSASVVWLLAGIGAAIGLGHYAVVIVISFVAVAILLGVEFLEKFFKELQRGVHKHREEDHV